MMLLEENEKPGQEQSPFLPTSATLDDLVERVSRRKTWRYWVVIATYMACWISAPNVVYQTAFAGIVIL